MYIFSSNDVTFSLVYDIFTLSHCARSRVLPGDGDGQQQLNESLSPIL